MKKINFNNDNIERLYSQKNLKWKFNEKERIQKLYWLNVDKNVFIVWNIIPLTSKNYSEHLLKTIEWLLEIWSQFIMIASAEEKFQKPIEELLNKYKWNIALLDDNDQSIRDIFSISDLCVFLSHTDDDIRSSMSYACVPIVFNDSKKSIISDFNPLLEKWNWFTINKSTMWSIFEWIIRAKESYKFPYDWENIKKRCLESSY